MIMLETFSRYLLEILPLSDLSYTEKWMNVIISNIININYRLIKKKGTISIEKFTKKDVFNEISSIPRTEAH